MNYSPSYIKEKLQMKTSHGLDYVKVETCYVTSYDIKLYQIMCS